MFDSTATQKKVAYEYLAIPLLQTLELPVLAVVRIKCRSRPLCFSRTAILGSKARRSLHRQRRPGCLVTIRRGVGHNDLFLRPWTEEWITAKLLGASSRVEERIQTFVTHISRHTLQKVVNDMKFGLCLLSRQNKAHFKNVSNEVKREPFFQNTVSLWQIRCIFKMGWVTWIFNLPWSSLYMHYILKTSI